MLKRWQAGAVAVASSALLVGVSVETLAQLPIGGDGPEVPATTGEVTSVQGLVQDDGCARVESPSRATSTSDLLDSDSLDSGSLDSDLFDSGPLDPETGQAIVVRVPPTAIIDVVDGRVVSALTNTGCAPRPTDDLFVRHPDGAIVELDGWRFDDVDWIGDFSVPGEPVPQHPAP